MEKPKPVPKKEENGDDVNGNTDLSVDDDDEWQVKSMIHYLEILIQRSRYILGYKRNTQQKYDHSHDRLWTITN